MAATEIAKSLTRYKQFRTDDGAPNKTALRLAKMFASVMPIRVYSVVLDVYKYRDWRKYDVSEAQLELQLLRPAYRGTMKQVMSALAQIIIMESAWAGQWVGDDWADRLEKRMGRKIAVDGVIRPKHEADEGDEGDEEDGKP